MAKFHSRGFASLLLSFSFLVVLVSGLVLWLSHSAETFGIDKGTWKHSHIFASLLMAAAAILHLVLNWPVYWSYLRRRAAGGLNLRRELVLALAIVVAVVGTSAFHGQGDALRRLGSMSLQQIAERSGQSVDQLVAALKSEGIHVHDAADSLAKIAAYNERPSPVICAIIQRQIPKGEAMRPGPRR